MDIVKSSNYRKDIDGLRAIAVLAVIGFHFGYLPNGYLGVDLFFVISGYLITGLLIRRNNTKTSIANFYERRARRIMPLLLVASAATLAMGIIVMLPDDLENLSQSVVASNLFSNNILQVFTTPNYWNISSDYKPLLHTWSLGIEEQFYLFYPLFFWLIGKNKKRLLALLIGFTLLSLTLYFATHNEVHRFYLIQYRFFELSLGGFIPFAPSIIINGRIKFIPVVCTSLLVGIFCWTSAIPSTSGLAIAVFGTLPIILLSEKVFLNNWLLVGIGKISFSLYMWHQPILVFYRYIFGGEVSGIAALLLLLLIIATSIVSYYFIEQPFRNKQKVASKPFWWTVVLLFLTTTIIALFVALRSGIVHNVPELDIVTNQITPHAHAKYNERIKQFDKAFDDRKALKVLVIGNSQARDWCNVLLESSIKDSIQLSYVEYHEKCADFAERCKQANYIFSSPIDTLSFNKNYGHYLIDSSKIRIIGVKYFGKSNGPIYNNTNNNTYYQQQTIVTEKQLVANQLLEDQWRNRYVNLLSILMNKGTNRIPVFTPDHKFISQDCIHLTKNGASYIAQLLNKMLHDWLSVEVIPPSQ